MKGKLIGYALIVFISISSIILFIINLTVWLLTVFFDKRLKVLQYFTCFWGALYTYVMPTWRIRVFDREKFDNNKTYLVVCNHQSQLDILVLFRLYKNYKFVSKSEIFRVPFIGWNMFLNRYIMLKRGDKSSVEKMLKDCENRIDNGSSVLFFPEGTRSKDGNIKEFKHGAFTIAKNKKVSILPILVNGTTHALPKHSMKTSGVHDIKLKVLDEIPYGNFEKLSVDDTSLMVRDVMIKGLKKLNAETEEN